MVRLTFETACAGQYIIWDHPSKGLITGIIARIGGAVIDEWGILPIWIVWDDIQYMLKYDETKIPEKLRYMATRHPMNELSNIDVYVFDTEQERLIGILTMANK